MTPGIRVIRFARAESGTRPGTGSVARVLLDEQSDSAGQIIQRGPLWEYVLADGTTSGLTSTMSRQDLERQVILYHLGPLPIPESGDTGPSLKLAM